jgi:hypothetical protein
MTEDSDKRRAQDSPRAKDSRQERLKLALRDNLKRRRAQARERSKTQVAPSDDHEDALDNDTGRKGRE